MAPVDEDAPQDTPIDITIDTPIDAALARRMWQQDETYHGLTYFTKQARAATDELGCKGGWMGYFGARSAPLGAAAPETVVSAFYNFHSSLVHRALPDAWAIASPERFLAARLTGMDNSLRDLLGAEVIASAELAEAAELLTVAAKAAPTAGRPLGAANARLDWPTPPHLALWHATTVLRESRGDGHIAALIAADLDPAETLVLFAAEKGTDREFLRKARGWPEPDWQAATDRLTARGLLDPAGAITDAGRALRADVELRTNLADLPAWRALGADGVARLLAVFVPINQRLAQFDTPARASLLGLKPSAR